MASIQRQRRRGLCAQQFIRYDFSCFAKASSDRALLRTASGRPFPIRGAAAAEERYRQTSLSDRQPHHSSFFDPEHRYPIPGETPSAEAQKHGMGKICDIRLKSQFISQTVGDSP